MEKLRVGYACLARLSFDGEYARSLFEESVRLLERLDIDLVRMPNLTITEEDGKALAAHFQREAVDAVLIQYGTFALGSLMPQIAQSFAVPIVIWAVPEPSMDGGKLRSNSLCGLNMNAHTLMRLGRPYDFVFRKPQEAAEDLNRVFRVLNCIKRLRTLRLGLVGYRVPGFYSSSCDELELRRKLGVEVYHVTVGEVYDAARAAGQTERARETAQMRARAAVVSVSGEELDQCAALSLGFQAVAAKYGLGALAVKCWPEFAEGYGIAPCASLSRVSDGGLLAACEGDIHGAVSMLIEHYLTGAIPFFADFVAIDEGENTGIGWHCGAAPASLATSDAAVQICKHPTVGGGGKKGVAMEFQLRGDGPLTMVRLGAGPAGLRLFFASGEAAKTGKILCGNTLAVRFERPVRQLLEIILREGVEHHFAMVHADIRPELRALARWLDLGVIDASARCD